MISKSRILDLDDFGRSFYSHSHWKVAIMVVWMITSTIGGFMGIPSAAFQETHGTKCQTACAQTLSNLKCEDALGKDKFSSQLEILQYTAKSEPSHPHLSREL